MRQRDWMWGIALLSLVGSAPRLESVQGESQTTYSAAEVPEGLKPAVDRVLPFAELPAAKAAMESSAMVGKIVVRVA